MCCGCPAGSGSRSGALRPSAPRLTPFHPLCDEVATQGRRFVTKVRCSGAVSSFGQCNSDVFFEDLGEVLDWCEPA